MARVDVNSRYDTVAEDYASVAIDVTRPVTAALLELCDVTAGDCVLDLASRRSWEDRLAHHPFTMWDCRPMHRSKKFGEVSSGAS